jgi:predicted alpha/beta hydrolase family esterase
MRKQVFVVHGGNAFSSHDEYIEHLKAKEVSLESLKYKDWKHGLAGTLGDAYEVIAPRMPSGNNAKYAEWKIWFEKFVPFLNDGVALVGHSLGGIFLAKYLSENAFPKKISGVFLVAAPYGTASQRPLADFVLGKDLMKLARQVGSVYLYHSRDDLVVPFAAFEQYAQQIPQAAQRVFEDRGHLNQEEFPELVEDIVQL